VIRKVRLSALERKAKVLLEKEGYSVTPMQHCFITRYKPVNLMARRNRREMLYLKLKETVRSRMDPASAEEFCKDDILIFSRLFPVATEPVDLRFAIWILHEESGFSCYEVFEGKIRDAGLAGNDSSVVDDAVPRIRMPHGSVKRPGMGTRGQSPAKLPETDSHASRRPLAGSGGVQP